MEKYSGKRDRIEMDLNQSMELSLSTSSPAPFPRATKLAPVRAPIVLPISQQETKEAKDDDQDQARDSRLTQMQQKNLDKFWSDQMLEINTSDFKNRRQSLPLATVKRVIKSNPNVKMISAETPIVLKKACEIFILELTLRAWLQTDGCNRRTMQKFDIERALKLDKSFGNFLLDAIRFDDQPQKNPEEVPERCMIEPSFPVVDLNN